MTPVTDGDKRDEAERMYDSPWTQQLIREMRKNFPTAVIAAFMAQRIEILQLRKRIQDLELR